MTGRIVKSLGGFFYVRVPGEGEYECRARGIFRKENIKPLVGDVVDITVTHQGDMEGSIDAIHPRTNSLVRPPVANIDVALVVFACADPDPNLNLLDKLLVSMEVRGIDSILCFNKVDLIDEENRRSLEERFSSAGYPVVFTDAAKGLGTERLGELLSGKVTTVAGPSGAGKSTLINHLCPAAEMATGTVSDKIGRGRHTTRHCQLFTLPPERFGPESYLVDTPGFTSLFTEDIEPVDLGDYFPEFRPFLGRCRFSGCVHKSEPDCAVKEAVDAGSVNRERYVNYIHLLEELESRNKYR